MQNSLTLLLLSFFFKVEALGSSFPVVQHPALLLLLLLAEKPAQGLILVGVRGEWLSGAPCCSHAELHLATDIQLLVLGMRMGEAGLKSLSSCSTLEVLSERGMRPG